MGRFGHIHVLPVTHEEGFPLTRWQAQQLFFAFDRNRDGRLMRRETRGWFTREFNTLDLNGDRIVTRGEMRRSLLGQPRRTYWGWR